MSLNVLELHQSQTVHKAEEERSSARLCAPAFDLQTPLPQARHEA